MTKATKKTKRSGFVTCNLYALFKQGTYYILTCDYAFCHWVKTVRGLGSF